MPYLAASLAQEGLCPDCRVSCPASSPAASRDSMSCSRTPQQERHLRHRRLSPSFLAEGHLTNHYAAALPKRNPKKNRTAKSWDFKVNLVYFPMTDDWLYTFGCGAMFPKQVERENAWFFSCLFFFKPESESVKQDNSKHPWKEDYHQHKHEPRRSKANKLIFWFVRARNAKLSPSHHAHCQL